MVIARRGATLSRGPLVLGDVGHALFRLSRARATSRSVGFDIKEVLYPGFEGRPNAATFEAFVENVEVQVDVYRLSHKNPLVYATGFGALILLALRARGHAPELPSVIQGAIPWTTVAARPRADPDEGERARVRYKDLLEREPYVHAHIHSPLDARERDAFFAGFATCTALPQIHEWLHRDWLAWLTQSLSARSATGGPGATRDIRIWLCGADQVIGEEEHDAAVAALGTDWPTERIEHWGHFPYLDAPGPWVGAIQGLGV